MLAGPLSQFEHLRAYMLDSIGVGLTMTDLQGYVRFANKEARRILGYADRDMGPGLLNFIDLTHPDDREANMIEHRRLLSGAIDQYCIDKRYLRRDGTVVRVHVTTSALLDEHGNIRGCCSAIEDVTSKTAILEQLLAAAETVSGVATWKFEIETGNTFASEGYNGLFGIDDDAPAPTLSEFIGRVHPEDRAAVSATIAKAITDRVGYTKEYRVQLADGTTRWLRCTAAYVFGPASSGPCLVGATVDITGTRAHHQVAPFLTASAIGANG